MTRTTTLTFSRKDGESLIVDHDIIVTVHHCRAGKAKVTIVSPADVNIVRAELLDDHAAAD